MSGNPRIKPRNHNPDTYRSVTIPPIVLENGKMQTYVRFKCFVKNAQGWGGEKCV